MKSTVEAIRERFDHDVERFSRLETGNTAQVDSLLSLELIAEAAATTNPNAQAILDVGCGAGNYVLKVLERLPNLAVTLLDLSQPMLTRAQSRVAALSSGPIQTLQADIREVALGEAQFDIILAAAVLHHLRTDEEWHAVYAKLYRALRPGGTLWIYDLVQHALPALDAQIAQRYARYLDDLGGPTYRTKVLGWIEQEDTPRPLAFQLQVMQAVGFTQVEVLHKHLCFAAFGGQK